ncbi:hypothetical protein NPIL_395351 [Nephila pilipes]|uniref:Uncharacterized protein n=1 Tax=Nephila pilipes TaxID=299642 RepID=A0A8X6Q2M3_NEPPI|nr:hypothetical protein NPIL_395351 [Nephila pilipes]
MSLTGQYMTDEDLIAADNLKTRENINFPIMSLYLEVLRFPGYFSARLCSKNSKYRKFHPWWVPHNLIHQQNSKLQGSALNMQFRDDDDDRSVVTQWLKSFFDKVSKDSYPSIINA